MIKNISLANIFKFAGGLKRPLKEGEQILINKRIIQCGFESRVSDKMKIVSLCMSSCRDKTTCYKVVITIKKKSMIPYCSCIAGANGKCKHVFGTLMYINRIGLENLPNLSCTDLQQNWGKWKKKANFVTGVSINNLCHYQKKQTIVKMTQDLEDDILQSLLSGVPLCEAAIHMARVRETSKKLNLPRV
ncbi:uncharacterized protein LOC127281438 [Leptopilina boulardi]|nr:uncharacterized protein LOC127281438 [Leptopilina boulardi]